MQRRVNRDRLSLNRACAIALSTIKQTDAGFTGRMLRRDFRILAQQARPGSGAAMQCAMLACGPAAFRCVARAFSWLAMRPQDSAGFLWRGPMLASVAASGVGAKIGWRPGNAAVARRAAPRPVPRLRAFARRSFPTNYGFHRAFDRSRDTRRCHLGSSCAHRGIRQLQS